MLIILALSGGYSRGQKELKVILWYTVSFRSALDTYKRPYLKNERGGAEFLRDAVDPAAPAAFLGHHEGLHLWTPLSCFSQAFSHSDVENNQ